MQTGDICFLVSLTITIVFATAMGLCWREGGVMPIFMFIITLLFFGLTTSVWYLELHGEEGYHPDARLKKGISYEVLFSFRDKNGKLKGLVRNLKDGSDHLVLFAKERPKRFIVIGVSGQIGWRKIEVRELTEKEK